MKDLFHDLRYVLRSARDAWKFCQHMRRGGNPDFINY